MGKARKALKKALGLRAYMVREEEREEEAQEEKKNEK